MVREASTVRLRTPLHRPARRQRIVPGITCGVDAVGRTPRPETENPHATSPASPAALAACPSGTSDAASPRPSTPSAAAGAGLAGLLYKLLTGGFGDQLLKTLFDHVLGLLGIG